MRGNDLTNKQFGRLKVLRYVTTDKNRNHIWECQCKCGNIIQISGVQLTRKNGSITCKKCHVIDGKNDIPTVAPWMEIYFKNKDDVYKYPYGSRKKVLVICPDCGREKYISVKDLYNNRSIGCICSDNISYPEKFVFSMLEQLGVDFIYQYSPEWINKKRFDFYIQSKKIIIEVDGGIGHGNRYTFNNYSMEELIEVDKYKEIQAKNKGLDVIRINAYPSNFNTIVNSIKEKLYLYFNLEEVDFIKCDKFGLKNLVKEICDKWNECNDIHKLCDMYKLSDVTIRSYLKRGSNNKWCDYNANEQKYNNILRSGNSIKVYKCDCFIGEFNSCAEFARTYNSSQDKIIINPKSLANAIKHNNKYKGLTVIKVKNNVETINNSQERFENVNRKNL